MAAQMFWKIFCLIFVIFGSWCTALMSRDIFDDFRAGKAPFFEMQCMRVGGTCARVFACPPGTRVGRRGLCPEQQAHGIECCRPFKLEIKCRDRNGDCVSHSFRCPRHLLIRDVTDCGMTEVCCAYEE